MTGDRTLSEITIRDVEDEGVNDTNKSRRQPDLETSCAFCLENVVYGSELTELHSCALLAARRSPDASDCCVPVPIN